MWSLVPPFSAVSTGRKLLERESTLQSLHPSLVHTEHTPTLMTSFYLQILFILILTGHFNQNNILMDFYLHWQLFQPKNKLSQVRSTPVFQNKAIETKTLYLRAELLIILFTPSWRETNYNKHRILISDLYDMDLLTVHLPRSLLCSPAGAKGRLHNVPPWHTHYFELKLLGEPQCKDTQTLLCPLESRKKSPTWKVLSLH